MTALGKAERAYETAKKRFEAGETGRDVVDKAARVLMIARAKEKAE